MLKRDAGKSSRGLMAVLRVRISCIAAHDRANGVCIPVAVSAWKVWGSSGFWCSAMCGTESTVSSLIDVRTLVLQVMVSEGGVAYLVHGLVHPDLEVSCCCSEMLARLASTHQQQPLEAIR
jgi:hypothetical protein